MKYLLLTLGIVLLPLSPATATEHPATIYTSTYKSAKSHAFKQWYALRDDDTQIYPRCKIAIEAARNNDPYMGQIAWECFKDNAYRGSISITGQEALHWLELGFSIGDPLSASKLGDLHARGFMGQKPNYEKAIDYYEKSIQWWTLAAQVIGEKPEHRNTFTYKKMASLKNALNCENAELELFGLKIKCTTQSQLEQALEKYEMRLIDARPDEYTWVYDSQNITSIPSVLIVRYSDDARIAKLEYVFPPKSGDHQYFHELLTSLVGKYGASDNNIQRPGTIKSTRNAEWRLADGLSIQYKKYKRHKRTLTYYNPYPSKLRYWALKHQKTAKDNNPSISVSKQISPIDLSAF